MKKTNPMKKTKPRTKPVVAKQPAKAHKRVAKTNQAAAATAWEAPSARESAGMDLLAEAIAGLAAIAAELRQIADDLRDLMGGPEQPELDALVITEVESPEGPEEES